MSARGRVRDETELIQATRGKRPVPILVSRKDLEATLIRLARAAAVIDLGAVLEGLTTGAAKVRAMTAPAKLSESEFMELLTFLGLTDGKVVVVGYEKAKARLSYQLARNYELLSALGFDADAPEMAGICGPGQP